MRKRHLVVLVFCFGLSLSSVFADNAAEMAASAAATIWLGQIDSANYANSWKNASVYFRSALTEKNWIDALNGTRKPLGKLLLRKLNKAKNAKSLPGAPDGNYVVMQFVTNFSNKKGAVETMTFMQEKDGKWRAAGYYIK